MIKLNSEKRNVPLIHIKKLKRQVNTICHMNKKKNFLKIKSVEAIKTLEIMIIFLPDKRKKDY